MAEESENKLVVNGIDGVTGQYLLPPLDLSAAAVALEPPSREDASPSANAKRNELKSAFLFGREAALEAQKLQPGVSFGLPADADPRDVSRAGWGVVFPTFMSATERDALKAQLNLLIEHRGRQVEADRFKPDLEYRPGESAVQFLKRYGMGLGDVDPSSVPYYLLLVGDPEQIPYDFQHTLSASYAVGRVSFESLPEYGQYARSVVAYETGSGPLRHKQVDFWGPRHAGDQATQMSADHLLQPLCTGRPPREKPVVDGKGYKSRCASGKGATKARLQELLHGQQVRPALLFTASHGLGFSANDEARQREAQGALLCQDWSGFGSISPKHYLAASDIEYDARLHGLVAFFFACFGAGTPVRDDFPFTADRKGAVLASRARVSPLPRRLLAHPNGGALAVISHVDRAWGYSIQPLGAGSSSRLPFRNTLQFLMAGVPVGHALRDFRDRCNANTHILLRALDPASSSDELRGQELVNRWIECNDARNYVVLGDPAVRLRPERLEDAP